jgi:hypothetical protein
MLPIKKSKPLRNPFLCICGNGMNFTAVEELQGHLASCELMKAGYEPILAAISPYMKNENFERL